MLKAGRSHFFSENEPKTTSEEGEKYTGLVAVRDNNYRVWEVCPSVADLF
jgi:hypothetical protein